MAYLVTGAAGFIGFHTVQALAERGEAVIGIDNVNDYYSVELKRARLAKLRDLPGFEFHQVDIANEKALSAALAGKPVRKIIHLAAQAGVRYSLIDPGSYVRSNLVGHVNMLEYCRNLDGFEHMAFASSSSIYGGRRDVPFRETDRTDQPVSLYAATKKSDEVLSHSYAHLYDLPMTGLRFFTVYGPWGRPDMAYFSFTKDILEGRIIKVFNHGKMERDFTYIDDIVDGVLRVVDAPPTSDPGPPLRVYNIGNNNPEKLSDFIAWLEQALGVKAVKEYLPMQPGDVPTTYADISAIERDHGFRPTTGLREGLSKFVTWYRSFYGV